MTRNETLKAMYKMANELVKDYSFDKNNALWEMAYDWNSEHEESEEIFMCEIWKEDGYEHDGFMIEDDIWYFED